MCWPVRILTVMHAGRVGQVDDAGVGVLDLQRCVLDVVLFGQPASH